MEKFENAVWVCSVDGRTHVIGTAFISTACRRPPAGGKANRLVGVTNSNGGQIVNNVFVAYNGYKEIALYFS